MYARHHFGWSGLTAVTEDRYRYIKAPHDEVYDLQRDPHERANVAADHGQTRQALRGVLDRLTAGAAPQPPAGLSGGDALADPKDQYQILETYRAAVDLAGDRKWPQAIALLQQILRTDPDMANVWSELATFAGRLDRLEVALDAYQHCIDLTPSDPRGYLGAAAVLLKQHKADAARERASLAVEVTPETDRKTRAAAHELLAKIALALHDGDAAREEAALAHKSDPQLPLPAFVDARLLYDQGNFADALPFFEQALKEQKAAAATAPMAELHYYAGETFARLERYPEAETQFTAELAAFPQNVRARAGLALLYHATDRADEAAAAIGDILRITPTPESYALASKLWTTVGNRQQADAVRAEARRAFDTPRGGGRATRR
jgi:tetratricopeptide (TPR) repeat protein